MQKTWIARQPEDLEAVATSLLQICKNQKKFAFYGDLGAGKTSLIKVICRQLAVENEVTSPTFALVNIYEGRQTVYHLDLYRLKDESEAIDIGIDDYLFDDTFCFIEWPEVIANRLPEDIVSVSLEVMPSGVRNIAIKA